MKHTVEEIELKNGARGLLIDVPNASVMTTKVHFRGDCGVRRKEAAHTRIGMEDDTPDRRQLRPKRRGDMASRGVEWVKNFSEAHSQIPEAEPVLRARLLFCFR